MKLNKILLCCLALLMSLSSCRTPREVAQGAPAWYESRAFWMGAGGAVAGGFLTTAIDDDADADVQIAISAVGGLLGFFFGNQMDLEWSRLTQDTPPWLIKDQPGTDSRYNYNENKISK